MNRILFKIGLLIVILLIFSGCRTDKFEKTEIVYEEDETESIDNIFDDPDSIDKEEASDTEKLFVSGRCEYNQFPGKAQIINIDIINSESFEIVFNFLLQNPEDKNNYRFPNFSDNEYRKMIIISPDDPNIIITETACIQIDNIELQSGDKLECIRLEITKGTCTPVIFFLPEIEKQSK